jgi:hypothetical protein
MIPSHFTRLPVYYDIFFRDQNCQRTHLRPLSMFFPNASLPVVAVLRHQLIGFQRPYQQHYGNNDTVFTGARKELNLKFMAPQFSKLRHSQFYTEHTSLWVLFSRALATLLEQAWLSVITLLMFQRTHRRSENAKRHII